MVCQIDIDLKSIAQLFVAACGDQGNDDDDDGGISATIPPDNGMRPGVSFQNDIFPILRANCSFAGCHSVRPK